MTCDVQIIKIFGIPATPQAERIFKELEKYPPHHLDENFTHKPPYRPYGFKIGSEVTCVGLTEWKDLYLETIKYLKNKDEDKFAELVEKEKSIFKRRRPVFSKNQHTLKSAKKINADLYVESNRSANDLIQNIKIILKFYGVDIGEMKIYLW